MTELPSQVKGQIRPTGTLPNIGEMAAGIRNPLSSIKGAVYYLSKKRSDEEVEKYLDIISKEINRLDQFITDLFSEITRSSMVIRGNVNVLLERLLLLLDLQLQSSGIQCSSEYGSLTDVEFNPFELGQAIMNVLNNAIESMASGGRLTVKTSSEKVFGVNFVTISISHTGKESLTYGEEVSPTDQEYKRPSLWMARKIMERHNGSLLIEKHDRIGVTVFSLSFPQRRKGKEDEFGTV